MTEESYSPVNFRKRGDDVNTDTEKREKYVPRKRFPIDVDLFWFIDQNSEQDNEFTGICGGNITDPVVRVRGVTSVILAFAARNRC